MRRTLITGAGGFIGQHLAKALKEKGHFVRGVDIKRPEFEIAQIDEFIIADLRIQNQAVQAMSGNFDEAYFLAADMGGMGFIKFNDARILRNNALININSFEAARQHDIKNILYSSSACVYPNYKQTEVDGPALKEDDVYPAEPQDGYGWEKLFTEQLALSYAKDYGLNVKVVRFHNIYGPFGTFDGGREKAPAALCRKVILAKKNNHDSIDIWGDGLQTRSFCYIDDCVAAMQMVMNSNIAYPINVGRNDLISINDLAKMIFSISGKEYIKINHVDGPVGVRGRNSDNSKFIEVFGWEPKTSMRVGLTKTYQWMEGVINGTNKL